MSAAVAKLCPHRVSVDAYCAKCDSGSASPASLVAHPAAELFPMMGDAELRDLANDIREHGLRDAILTFEGMVLDGRNRLRACELADVEPRFKDWVGDEPTAFVISANLHRRQLTKGQLAAIGAEAMPLLQAEAKERQRVHGGTAPGRPKTLVHNGAEVSPNAGRARQATSEHLGGAVSGMSIQRAASVKAAAPDVFEEIKAGKITIHSGLRKAGLNKNGAHSRIQPSRFEITNERHRQVAEANKLRLERAVGACNGLARGLGDIKAERAIAVASTEELSGWDSSFRDAIAALKKLRARIKEASP